MLLIRNALMLLPVIVLRTIPAIIGLALEKAVNALEVWQELINEWGIYLKRKDK